MTARTAAVALALVGAAGCASFGGRSRTFDPAELRSDEGWIAAPPTPVVRQAGAVDCGAAALVMVAGRWQVPLSLEGAAGELPAPSPRGARLGELRDVARAHGLRAFAIAGDRATLLHELRAGRPVIVGLHIPAGPRRALSHYEVIVAVHPADDRFASLDPAAGWRVRRWAELDGEWLPAGRPALVVIGTEAAQRAEPEPRGATAPPGAASER